MATGTCYNWLSEAFIESYYNKDTFLKLELQARVRGRRITEKPEVSDNETDEGLHHFALRLRKPANCFYQTLTDAEEAGYA